MTISTTTARIRYSGNGVTTVFSAPWRLIEKANLRVTILTALGAEVDQTLTTNYTVTGEDTNAASVTMLVAPAVGEILVLRTSPPVTQTTAYSNGGIFPAASHERALDKLTLEAQRLEDLGKRSIHFPPTDPVGLSAVLPIDTARASRVMAFDSAGSPVAGPLVASLGTVGVVREKLTADRTYYVATTGSDSNTGLAVGTPFLTIAKAYAAAAALDCSTFNLTIQIADGTYTATGNLPDMLGSGVFTVLGNPVTPASCLLAPTTGTCFFYGGNGTNWSINGFKIQAASGSGIFNAGVGTITFSNIDFGTCSSAHINSRWPTSQISPATNYVISGSATYHINFDFGATAFFSSRTVTFLASVTFTAFVRLSGRSFVAMASMTFTLGAFTVTGQRFNVGAGCILDTSGGGASYLPGSTAGSGTNFSASPWGLYT